MIFILALLSSSLSWSTQGTTTARWQETPSTALQAQWYNLRESGRGLPIDNQVVEVELQGSPSSRSVQWIGVGMSQRKNAQLGSGFHPTDLSFGYQRFGRVELLRWHLGVAGNLSMGPAEDPRWGSVTSLNAWSGMQSLTPAMGLRLDQGAWAWGLQAEARLQSDIRYLDQQEIRTFVNPSYALPRIRGHLELYFSRELELRMDLMIGRQNFSAADLILGAPGNEYSFGTELVWDTGDLRVRIPLLVEELKHPLVTSNFRAGLALLWENL